VRVSERRSPTSSNTAALDGTAGARDLYALQGRGRWTGRTRASRSSRRSERPTEGRLGSGHAPARSAPSRHICGREPRGGPLRVCLGSAVAWLGCGVIILDQAFKDGRHSGRRTRDRAALRRNRMEIRPPPQSPHRCKNGEAKDRQRPFVSANASGQRVRRVGGIRRPDRRGWREPRARSSRSSRSGGKTEALAAGTARSRRLRD